MKISNYLQYIHSEVFWSDKSRICFKISCTHGTHLGFAISQFHQPANNDVMYVQRFKNIFWNVVESRLPNILVVNNADCIDQSFP